MRYFFYQRKNFIVVSWRDNEQTLPMGAVLIAEDSPEIMKKTLAYLKKGMADGPLLGYHPTTALSLFPTKNFPLEEWEGKLVGTEASLFKHRGVIL